MPISEQPGSPYQVMNSHRRYSSAIGQNSDEDKIRKPKTMQGNVRQAASVLSKIPKPMEAGGDKSSLFAEIVSLRDSASSRQNRVNNN